jgi:hypothetical protein
MRNWTPPVIPQDGRVIIAVRRRRAQVARYRQIGAYWYEVEIAQNWQALEAAAVAVVEGQIGAIVEDEDYPCPPELAAQAVWKG